MYNQVRYSEYATKSAKRIFIKNSLDFIELGLLDNHVDVSFSLGIYDLEGQQFVSDYIDSRCEAKRKRDFIEQEELQRRQKLKEQRNSRGQENSSSSNSDMGLTGATMGIIATTSYDSYSSSSYGSCSSSSSSSSCSSSSSSSSSDCGGGCD